MCLPGDLVDGVEDLVVALMKSRDTGWSHQSNAEMIDDNSTKRLAVTLGAQSE